MNKRLSILCAAVAFCTLVLSSCSLDNNDTYPGLNYTYGTVSGADEDSDFFDIDADNGLRISVRENLVPQVKVKDGDRVYAMFVIVSQSPLPGGLTQYRVKLNNIHKVYVGGVIPASEVTDQTGNDGLFSMTPQTGLTYSGGYLNIDFVYYAAEEAGVQHDFTLVCEAQKGENNATVFTLRHHAHGEVPGGDKKLVQRMEKASFDIASFLPVDVQMVPIKLQWQVYGSGNALQQRSFLGYIRNDAAVSAVAL